MNFTKEQRNSSKKVKKKYANRTLVITELDCFGDEHFREKCKTFIEKGTVNRLVQEIRCSREGINRKNHE